MSETVTDYLCECVFLISDRLLSVPMLAAIINDTEERLGKQTPWDSVYKLDALARKIGKTTTRTHQDRAAWCLQSISDLIIDEQVSPGEFSVRNLTGKGIGNRGALDLFLYKRDCLDFLLHTWLPKLPVADPDKLTIRSTLSGFEAYRAQMGYTNDLTRDLSWLGILSPAGRAALHFIKARAHTRPIPNSIPDYIPYMPHCNCTSYH
jgi:hypothetical protein